MLVKLVKLLSWLGNIEVLTSELAVIGGGGGSFIEDSHPIKRREVVILFIASSYESWDKLQLSGPLDSST